MNQSWANIFARFLLLTVLIGWQNFLLLMVQKTLSYDYVTVKLVWPRSALCYVNSTAWL